MTMLLYFLFVILPLLYGFQEIITRPYSTIHLQASELEKRRLADNFIGQEMTFTSSNPLLIIEPGVIEMESCPNITKSLQENEFIKEMKIYEDVAQPFQWRVLFFLTTKNRVLMAEIKCKNSTNCIVHECDAMDKKIPFMFSWGQVGNNFLFVSYMEKNNLSLRLINPTDSMCKIKKQFYIKHDLLYNIPLDDTMVLGEIQDRLRIKVYNKTERSLYVNIPPPKNPLRDIAVLFPLVITLEALSNNIAILKFVEEYQDLVQLSTLVVPQEDILESLYVTLHDPTSLYAVCTGSDKVYLFNIEDPEFPRIAKIYYDQDYIIPTSLSFITLRIAMSQDFVAVLAGDQNNMILRAIHKDRGINNYLIKDISLGNLVSHISLVVLNYYDNSFLVSNGNHVRAFRFTEQNLILNGEKLCKSEDKPTYIQASIQVKNNYTVSSQSIDRFM